MRKVVPSDHILFQFEMGNECSGADKRFIDQICLQLGFKRSVEILYLAGIYSSILDLYPEIGYFRDLVFMFKLVMVPTSDKLPELRPWDPEEVALRWSVDEKALLFTIKGTLKICFVCRLTVVSVCTIIFRIQQAVGLHSSHRGR
jgi:hypothetical protein